MDKSVKASKRRWANARKATSKKRLRLPKEKREKRADTQWSR